MIIGMDWDWFNRDGWPQLVLIVSLALMIFLPEVVVVAYLFGWRP
jgi:hypothetical protein